MTKKVHNLVFICGPNYLPYAKNTLVHKGLKLAWIRLSILPMWNILKQTSLTLLIYVFGLLIFIALTEIDSVLRCLNPFTPVVTFETLEILITWSSFSLFVAAFCETIEMLTLTNTLSCFSDEPLRRESVCVWLRPSEFLIIFFSLLLMLCALFSSAVSFMLTVLLVLELQLLFCFCSASLVTC